MKFSENSFSESFMQLSSCGITDSIETWTKSYFRPFVIFSNLRWSSMDLKIDLGLLLHLILWIRNPETLTRPLGFLIFTTAFKKFAWSPRALGQFLIPLPQAILGCSLSISSDFALLLKRCVSTRGFGCTDRELLAPQICWDIDVFVSDLWFLISWIS